MATEETALLTPLVADDEGIAQLRDKVNTSYTTIALVSALLSAVSFAAYSTPPSLLFTATGGTPPPAPPAPLAPVALAGNETSSHAHFHVQLPSRSTLQSAEDAFLQVLWHVYGIVLPLAFVCNLAGTLSASGVILYVNSNFATGPAVRKLFGNKHSEHAIIMYPSGFLVCGVVSLFVGFAIGIALFYGLGVAALTGLMVLVAYVIYDKCFAHAQSSETFNALNVSLMALFFRSCLPDLAREADTHPAAVVPFHGFTQEEGPDPEKAEEEEREARKRAVWEERSSLIGRAVATQLRAEPVTVRSDPADETRAFAKKGCC